MAIKAKNVTAHNKDGEAVNLAGSGSNFGNVHMFSIIPAGYRTAIIEKVEETTFNMTVKGFENPDREDGKWVHIRLTPKFRLLNDEGSIISKQSFIVGAQGSDGDICAPNPENDVIWGGQRGARDLLQSLKLFTEDGDGGFNLTLHSPAIRGMAVRVATSVGGYKKGSFDITPVEMLALLNQHSESVIDFGEALFDRDAISEALAALNAHEGLDEETGYKLKNVIVKIQAMWPNKAEAEGLYAAGNTGQVFTSEDAADAYVNAMHDSDLNNDF